MHRNPSRRRSAARLLSLAAVAGLGHVYNTAPDPANPPAGGGGGGGAPPKANKPPEDQPKKLELTEEEIESRINARLDAERRKAEDKVKREREEADRKAAEEQGKFKELADAERAKREAAEAENRTLKTRIALGDHLAAKHPEYVGRAKYILPLIPADTADDQLAKAVETAAAEFVKDNPVQPKGSAGAPPSPRGSGVKPPELGRAANGHPNRLQRQGVAADSF
jgi:hypothetical protein